MILVLKHTNYFDTLTAARETRNIYCSGSDYILYNKHIGVKESLLFKWEYLHKYKHIGVMGVFII